MPDNPSKPMTHAEIMAAIDDLLDRQFDQAERLGMTREELIAKAEALLAERGGP